LSWRLQCSLTPDHSPVDVHLSNLYSEMMLFYHRADILVRM